MTDAQSPDSPADESVSLAIASLIAAGVGALPLDHEPVADEQVIAGAPTTAFLELGNIGVHEIGLWEMTPGTMSDTEVTETSIVLGGAGTVRFADGSELALAPGTLFGFVEGEQTVWTVTETVRKLYII